MVTEKLCTPVSAFLRTMDMVVIRVVSDMNAIDTPVLYTLLEVQSLIAYWHKVSLRGMRPKPRERRKTSARRDRVPSPSLAHVEFPASLRTAQS